MNTPKPFNSWDEYFEARSAFYHSQEWHELRKKVIERSDGRCVYCGRYPTNSNPINIDHRIPLCRRWDLRNCLANLQLTCRECNKIKGGKSHHKMKKLFEPPKPKKKLTRKERCRLRAERRKKREEKQRAEQKRKNDAFFANYLK